MKHKRLGFTIVELIITIVIIAILASITTIAYRETQKNARNEARKTDVAILMGALEEYRADKGGYPVMTTCTTGPGGANECYAGEVWTLLKDDGYLNNIPLPGLKYSSYNYAPDGKAHYAYYGPSTNAYAIMVLMEPARCKTGKNVKTTWWSSTPMCDF